MCCEFSQYVVIFAYIFTRKTTQKMETIAEKLKKKSETTYQKVAREFDTTELYVGQIAREERIPKRGKGLEIKARLKELTK